MEKNTNPFDQDPYLSKTGSTSRLPKDKESISHKVGDSIERLGEKVIRAGAETVGRAIYNAGNKIEHMDDEKKTGKTSGL